MSLATESLFLWIALMSYVAAGGAAMVETVWRRPWPRLVISLLGAGLALHGVAIGLRWERLGHGPFVSLFEILSSNVWSLTLILMVVYSGFRALRPVAAVILPMLFVMMAWLLWTSSQDSLAPPTYDTVWLYLHVGFGKIFLGGLLVAAGLGVVVVVRGFGWAVWSLLPDDQVLDDWSYRFLAIGLIFDTLMVMAGAIWAQDAWGRYWNWDPMETWSLINWLFLAMALHIRPLFTPPPRFGAVVAMVAFAVAFLTFFGVPFLSKAPHQGMV